MFLAEEWKGCLSLLLLYTQSLSLRLERERCRAEIR